MSPIPGAKSLHVNMYIAYTFQYSIYVFKKNKSVKSCSRQHLALRIPPSPRPPCRWGPPRYCSARLRQDKYTRLGMNGLASGRIGPPRDKEAGLGPTVVPTTFVASTALQEGPASALIGPLHNGYTGHSNCIGGIPLG